jgi:Rha family phage regulatory protein
MRADADLNFFSLIDADHALERLTTTSLRVAAVHGKRHDNVLRVVRACMTDVAASDSPEFNALNFQFVDYSDAKGEARPMCVMSQEG